VLNAKGDRDTTRSDCQDLDIMRNAAIRVEDRVREYRYSIAGNKFGALPDGLEHGLSWIRSMAKSLNLSTLIGASIHRPLMA
jgi:hypothetical protein